MADPDQLPSPHGHGGPSLVISSRSTTKTSCTWMPLNKVIDPDQLPISHVHGGLFISD